MIEKLKEYLSHHLEGPSGFSQDQIMQMLEKPKNIDHGHLSFPVFGLSKVLKKNPNLIAQEIRDKIGTIPHVLRVDSVGGYINFSFDSRYVQGELSKAVCNGKAGPLAIGYKVKNNKRIVIDYSSPNVAKPMSIGHMRATIIGQAIRNLAESQGYDVIGLNYLGDWGVQFGKLAYAYLVWSHESGNSYDFEKNPFESLFQIYVDFHKACEENPDLEEKGSLTFKRLEEGDPEIKEVWKKFLDISLNEYNRIYDLLNVKFDLIQGESFYNDKLEPTIELLKKEGLLEESDGAQVVFLGDEMPPCIIKKSDGASLYATRDIASALYRHEHMKADELIYVVGVDQDLHFKQVFAVLNKLGKEWSKDCHHISFGMYRFKDQGKMSTRRGRVVFMDDVLSRAIDLAKQIIQEKNPSLTNKDQVATQVGVGAIIFNDLSTDRVRNVDFDWEKALDFEGDSGPYIQYCIVRCRSILSKFGQDIPQDMTEVLSSKEEMNLIKQLLNYSEALTISYRNYKPSFLAQYLLETCRLFNSFYQNHKVLDENLDQNMKLSRLRLIECVESILSEGLRILGVQSPDRM